MRSVVFFSHFTRALAAATFSASTLAVLASCSNEPTRPEDDIVPATIVATVTGSLTGVAGAQLTTPLTVVVTNKGGFPIDSAVVTFAVTGGGGSVAATSVRTNLQGQASTTWTLGSTVGAQSATATAGILPPATFSAVATAAPAAAVAKAGGDAQTAPAGTNVGTPPAVRVADQFGNPVAGVTVNFVVASGGGVVTGGAAVTGADGTARPASWRLGNTAGANSLTATAGTLAPLTFTATGVPGAVAVVQITNAPPTLAAGQAFTLTTRALDQFNNVVPGAAFAFVSSDPTVATVGAASGAITGVGPGATQITATSGSVSANVVVTVIGHPNGTAVGTVIGRIAGLSITGSTGFIGHPFSLELAFVDMSTATTTTNTAMLKPINDVASPLTGTGPIAVGTTSTVGLLWFVDQNTRARLDSIELSAPPARVGMTSTGSRVFVAMNSFNVAFVDVATRSIVTTQLVPGTATALRVGPGDTLVYIGTQLGAIFEINAATGAIRRQFTPTASVKDLGLSPDGKTLFIADGTNNVTLFPLAAGGLSGTVDFGAPVSAVAMTPDGAELWAGMAGVVVAAPYVAGEFQLGLVNKRYTNGGTNPSRIVFNRFGSFAAIQDDGVLAVYILR